MRTLLALPVIRRALEEVDPKKGNHHLKKTVALERIEHQSVA
jgi:hypothetical protein